MEYATYVRVGQYHNVNNLYNGADQLMLAAPIRIDGTSTSAMRGRALLSFDTVDMDYQWPIGPVTYSMTPGWNKIPGFVVIMANRPIALCWCQLVSAVRNGDLYQNAEGRDLAVLASLACEYDDFTFSGLLVWEENGHYYRSENGDVCFYEYQTLLGSDLFGSLEDGWRNWAERTAVSVIGDLENPTMRLENGVTVPLCDLIELQTSAEMTNGTLTAAYPGSANPYLTTPADIVAILYRMGRRQLVELAIASIQAPLLQVFANALRDDARFNARLRDCAQHGPIQVDDLLQSLQGTASAGLANMMLEYAVELLTALPLGLRTDEREIVAQSLLAVMSTTVNVLGVDATMNADWAHTAAGVLGVGVGRVSAAVDVLRSQLRLVQGQQSDLAKLTANEASRAKAASRMSLAATVIRGLA